MRLSQYIAGAFALVLFAVIVGSGGGSAANAYQRDAWQTGSPDWRAEIYHYQDIPPEAGNISVGRVFPAQGEKGITLALSLLKERPIVPLDENLLAQIVPRDTPTSAKAVEASVLELTHTADASPDPRYRQMAVAESHVDPKTLKAYLVRAVVVNLGTGRFMIYQRGDDLWIDHGSLGEGEDRRLPVVIYLDREPRRLFVTASSAL